ncbi:MAG: DUF308 domain-containing protein [Clostridia bacterium]|nr:DUF308 domain-containing protein [Clostridia bacterium]
MRILTVIAGILITACGAFCFAFSGNVFQDVAFVVGAVMVISGACNIGSYLVSGKGFNRLTETTLVEGLVTTLYGFAVLTNSVTDVFMTMFFGTWLTVCGITRFSQSIYVSRFNPKDWAKIVPLSAIASMLGVVMMMPKLVAAAAPLMLLGGAFIFDGLSMLTFAMYIKRRATGSDDEIKAKERAEARKAVARAEIQERERLRSLSKSEREAEIEHKRKIKEREEKARKEALAKEKAARRESSRPDYEKTVELTDDEVEQINIAVNGKVIDIADNTVNPMADIWKKMAKEEGGDVTVNKVKKSKLAPSEVVPSYVKADEKQTHAVWQRPTEIPKVKQNTDRGLNKDNGVSDLKIAAINLEEIESGKPMVEFDSIKLPELKFESDYLFADRSQILKDIKDTKIENTNLDYTPIELDDLVSEPLEKPYDPKESKRFTQTLSFEWTEAKPEEKK